MRGIRFAYQSDKSFHMEVWGCFPFIAIAFLLWPLTETEFLFLILAYALILVTELTNTALETAFKKLHPEHHELIGASKDIASGAVLVSFIFAGIVVAIITFAHSSLLV